MAMKPKPQKQVEKQREKKKLSEALRKNLMRRKALDLDTKKENNF